MSPQETVSIATGKNKYVHFDPEGLVSATSNGCEDVVSVTRHTNESEGFEYWSEPDREGVACIAEYVITTENTKAKIESLMYAFKNQMQNHPDKSLSSDSVELALNENERTTTHDSVVFVTRELKPTGEPVLGVHVHTKASNGSVSDINTPDFYRPTQSVSHVNDFITTIIECDANLYDSSVNHLFEKWVATKPTQEATQTNKNNESGESIEDASDYYHTQRMYDSSEQLVGTVDFAVRLNPASVILKVSVLDDTYYIELPDLVENPTGTAWEIHKSIIDLHEETGTNADTQLLNVSVNDYVGKEITIQFSDEKNTCTINRVNEDLPVKDTITAITRSSHLNSDWAKLIFNHEISPYGEPFAGLPHQERHTNISLIGSYHEQGEPLTCTVAVDEENTSTETITLTLNIDGTDESVTTTFDMPETITTDSYAVTAIEELGGGEIKFIDGAKAHLFPQNADAFTSKETRPDTIGTTDNGKWWIMTDTQYTSYKTTQTSTKTKEEITHKINTYKNIKEKFNFWKPGLHVFTAFFGINTITMMVTNSIDVTTTMSYWPIAEFGLLTFIGCVLILIITVVSDILTKRTLQLENQLNA